MQRDVKLSRQRGDAKHMSMQPKHVDSSHRRGLEDETLKDGVVVAQGCVLV